MICENCNLEFKKTGRNQKFCSKKCQRAYSRTGLNYCQICLRPLNYKNRNRLKARKYCEECSYKEMRRKDNERRRIKRGNY